MSSDVVATEKKAPSEEKIVPSGEGKVPIYKNKLVHLVGSLLIGAIIWFLPNPADLPLVAQHSAAVLITVILLGSTNCIPVGLASMLMIGFVTMFMAKELPPGTFLSYWTSDTIWFILVCFGFGAMMQLTGLGKRLASYVFSMKSLIAINLVLFGVSVLMSLGGIANTTPKIAMIIPLILSMAALSSLDKTDPYVKNVAITFSCTCTTVGLLFYSGGFINTMLGQLAGFDLSFASYFAMYFVPALILNVVVLFTCYFVFRPKKGSSPGFDPEKTKALRKDMGKLSAQEWKAIFWICVALVLWATAGKTGFKTGFIAVFVICFAMMPKIGAITFNDYLKNVNWGVVFMILGVLCVASFAGTGLVTWFWAKILPENLPENKMLLLLFVSFASELLHIPFGAIAGAISLAIPTFAGLADQIGIAKECVVYVSHMSLTAQFFFPYQAVTMVAAMAFGIFDSRDVLKIGSVLFIVVPIVSAILCYPWYMMMGWV